MSPFVGDPRECRGDVAFPPSFGPQPSGAIEETGTIFESTLCCVVGTRVWTAPTQEDNDDEDVVGDDGDVCALCCTKSDREKMSMCDKCELQYWTDSIDTRTCDNVTFV